MIGWKQRLYAFLLRRVLGPLLDASSAQKLHDSIDVSLQEGKFVLKNIDLDAAYLTEKLSESCPGLRVRSGRIDRLEINLRLRENYHNDDSTRTQSSLAWRAMKLGSMNESLPAVSLIAESMIDGIFIELETIDRQLRKSIKTLNNVETQISEEKECEEENTSKNIIGSYIEAALATLQLNIQLTNIHLKFFHGTRSNERKLWVGVKVSSFSYSDQDLDSTHVGNASTPTIANKAVDFSQIIVEAGEESTAQTSAQNSLVVAMAEGNGQLFLRIVDCDPSQSRENENHDYKQRDVDIRLNHRFNFSFDQQSFAIIQQVIRGYTTITEANSESDEVAIFQKSSIMNNPHFDSPDLDREDLKALTGIMRQYREAFHMAEKKRLTGGILVPSNAYLDDAMCDEEIDDETTFDMFFDANEQSLYNTTAVLMESTQLFRDSQNHDCHSDHIHTKLRMNLLSSCFKINFREPGQKRQFSHAEEYVLATLDDLNFSLSSSQRSSEMDLRITHFQIEDAYLSTQNMDTQQNAVKIGSILGWSQGEGYEEDTALVSEAPCLNVRFKSIKKSKKEQEVNCSVALLPLELSFRQRTMENITKFGSAVDGGLEETSSPVPSPGASTSDESRKIAKNLSLSLECPSMCLYLPLVDQTPLAPLFDRCGETLRGVAIRETSIGFMFENAGFDLNLQQNQDVAPDLPEISGKFWCLNMGAFVLSPKRSSGYEAHMLRKDIFIASGRTEVNPCIPISFGFRKGFSVTRDKNPGRESFPIVPAISSFKARQEDDDENTSTTRNDLRGTDPQIIMLENAEKSTTIVTMNIPETILDLTKAELETFLLLLKSIEKPTPAIKEKGPTRSISQGSVSEKLSVAVNLDRVTVSIRDDQETYESNGRSENEIYSFLLSMDKIKSHISLDGSDVKHFRLLSQDLCFYSSHGKPSTIDLGLRDVSLQGRFRTLKNGLRAFSEVTIVPIIFRSQLFTPISQDTPSILLDFTDLSAPSKNAFQQRRVYFTFYHLTFRYNVDSNWVERLSAILPRPGEEEKENPTTNLDTKEIQQETTERSLTRLFVSFADVNIDYTAPSYFETRSKSMIRIGDLRVSSNIMKPSGLNQSYSLSIGDVTYHISCDAIGNQHRNEDSLLCRSLLIVKNANKSEGRKTSLFGTMPEAILRELNYVNVVSLDAMDAVVTRRIEEVVTGCDRAKHPIVAINLNIGTISVHACKDSFGCFAHSIEELQSKLIGLTDGEIDILSKEESVSATGTEVAVMKKLINDESKQSANRRLAEDIKIPVIVNESPSIDLLDGHEWTTVDKDDFSPGLVIPPGDEQISGWYNTSYDKPSQIGAPSQIIHQHFPLHSFADPLSEGDMGARALAGEKADLFLKSRLSITKLNVKIRLFDGYDWPDKCSASQKRAVKRSGKTFVIEPLPGVEERKEEDLPEEKSTIGTKARLMDQLLDLDEDNSETCFQEVLLPEDKMSKLEHEKYLRMSRRRPNAFCQVSLQEISLRMDSYEPSKDQRLKSILEVSVSNLFVAETVSDGRPLKMIGEWNNDYEHPRDTRFGTLMLNMATWAPAKKFTDNKGIASEECSLSVQLMPMRCLLDQRAISYMKAFFNSEDSQKPKHEKEMWSFGLHLPPPPTVKSFKIKPWKVKVDYYPTRVDVEALREGSVVELVNLSPIQRMVITLDEVVVLNSDGFGPVFSETVSSWIKEICGTQLHKFLTNARPFEPFTDVGQGLTDLIILPYEAFKQGDSVQRAMTNGVISLAETVVFQTLATTSGLTKMAAGLMADSLGLKGRNDASDPLPSRPNSIPRGIGDARLHAAKSLARGLSAANYKVVVVPYREYLRTGVSGAMTSVIKGIPVLLVAPLSGATEAASYTLLGARNALRPDLRKEEEASVL